MRVYRFLGVFFYILVVGFVLSFASCGGSNLNNPVSETDATTADSEATDDIVELTENPDAAETTEQVTDLDVKITVTQKTVEPGEDVEITASVKGVRGTSVTLNWLNITQFGMLSNSNENSVTWTAPQTLNGESIRVEVIQLVVTVISEVVSVGASGIDTDTQIFSETKTVLLTVRD